MIRRRANQLYVFVDTLSITIPDPDAADQEQTQ